MNSLELPKRTLNAPPLASRERRSTPSTTIASPTSRVLLVDFRAGEAVDRHPEVLPLAREGWVVKSAVPRLVENQGLKLLVVLKRNNRILA